MKKIGIYLGIIFALFTLASCKKEAVQTLKIAVPSGAPVLSQLTLLEKSKESDFTLAGYKVSFDIVNGADGVKAAITSKSHAVVVAPINLGATLYKNGSGYQYLANVTKGNLFLASTTKIESLADLNGKDLVLFGENTINQAVVLDILTKNNITLASEITYLADTSKTQAELVADQNSNTVYLVAEPVLTAAKTNLEKNGKTLYQIDVQKEFEVVNQNHLFLQAGIFGQTGLAKEFIDAYLAFIEAGIEYVNENPQAAAELALELETGLPAPAILAKAIKGCNLNFLTSRAAKESFSYLVDLAPKYFGGEQPSADFYY